MRITHVINSNTLLAYEPSATTLTQLLGELHRRLRPEDFAWDDTQIPTLCTLCVRLIAKHFQRNPILYDVPPFDHEFLLEEIATDLPLELCVPLVQDEYYWERRYRANFRDFCGKHPGWTWKCVYLERQLQELCEQAEPQYQDEDEIKETAQLCSEYIHVFRINQLRHWVPPKTWQPEEVPEIRPTTHINLKTILDVLPNVTRIEVSFGMSGVGMDYEPHMFEMSPSDLEWLGEGAAALQQLDVLKIHRCSVRDEHVKMLVRKLLATECLIELEISHCQLADGAALYLSNMILEKDSLKNLILRNNRIGILGCTGLGKALLEPEVYLDHLDLSLNPLGHDATVRLMSALVRGTNLRELVISGCGIEGFTAVLVGRMIRLNSSLVYLDISNNAFGKDGGEAIELSLQYNIVLRKLEYRNTEIPTEIIDDILAALARNRELKRPTMEEPKVKPSQDVSVQGEEEERESLYDQPFSVEMMNIEF